MQTGEKVRKTMTRKTTPPFKKAKNDRSQDKSSSTQWLQQQKWTWLLWKMNKCNLRWVKSALNQRLTRLSSRTSPLSQRFTKAPGIAISWAHKAPNPAKTSKPMHKCVVNQNRGRFKGHHLLGTPTRLQTTRPQHFTQEQWTANSMKSKLKYTGRGRIRFEEIYCCIYIRHRRSIRVSKQENRVYWTDRILTTQSRLCLKSKIHSRPETSPSKKSEVLSQHKKLSLIDLAARINTTEQKRYSD
jgi:hypothetical protein